MEIDQNLIHVDVDFHAKYAGMTSARIALFTNATVWDLQIIVSDMTNSEPEQVEVLDEDDQLVPPCALAR